MSLSASELAQIVWAETNALGPSRADGSGDVNGVRRLVAQLAASLSGARFNKRQALPPLTDPQYGETARAIMGIADAAKDAATPQPRLIFWNAGPVSSKLNVATNPSPPEPWASADPSAISNKLRQQISDGRTIDVFSRSPLPGERDGPPLVNMLTGTGLPDAKPIQAVIPAQIPRNAEAVSAQTPKNPYVRPAWWIGVAGVLLFIAGGAMSAVTGLSMSGARDSLGTTDTAYQRLLLLKAADICVKDYQSLPGAALPDLCSKLLGDNKLISLPKDAGKIQWSNSDQVLKAIGACAQDPTQAGCSTAWQAAVAANQDQTWKKSFFGWMYAISGYLTGASADPGSASILIPFLITIIGVVGLIVALGLGTVGRAAGVWIDTRNRVSLARAQVTLWTVVALGGYLVLAMFNIGFTGFLQSAQALASYHAFPSIPGSIAAVLGIATGSTMLSSLILSTKDKGPNLTVQGAGQDLTNRGAPFFGNQTSGLDKQPSPALASMADIFMGEENADSDTVDVSRLQNVMITITLVFGFFALLVQMMSNIKMTTLLGAHDSIFSQLPDPGSSFAWLLAVSHATYLVSKAHDSQDHGP
jgi:hypothetical protein